MSIDKNLNKEKAKKLKVNKRGIQRRKNKCRLIIGTLSTILIVSSGSAIFKKYNTYKDQQQVQTIVNYYGENSEEKNIIDYIEISEKLNSMNLSNYSFNEELFTKYNISNELKTPEEINQLINDAKEFNLFISSKDLKKQSLNVEVRLNLIKQEQLVNDYIYSIGYNRSNSNAREAVQNYAGEVFGVKNTNDIDIKFDIRPADGQTTASLTFNTEEGTKNYLIEDTLFSEEKKDIKAGARAMNNANNIVDDNEYDNDKYNEKRNEFIKEALEQSVILNTKVDEEDLYDENLAKKIR